MINHRIVDPKSGDAARVTEFGQLVVSPVAYNAPAYNALTLDNTPVNFIEPKAGKRIVIDGILFSSRRDVGTAGVNVTVYAAEAPDTSTIAEPILTADLIRQGSRDIVGLNLIVSSGLWVNAVADDSTVDITILWYYVPID